MLSDATEKEAPCEGCARGKMSMSKFAYQSCSQVKMTGLLEIVHSDVMRPTETRSKGEAHFVVTFIDDYSRYVHLYLLKSKAEVF